MEPNEEGTVYLTPSQAARLLGVSAKTVDRWADSGRLSCLITFGRHRRFPLEEVMRVQAIMRPPTEA